MSSSTSAAAAEFARRRQAPLQRLQHVLHGRPWLSPLLLLVLTYAIFGAVDSRVTATNAIAVNLQQTAVIACLAIGQTLIILTAGIDLAVGATTVLSMMVMASVATEQGLPGPLAILIGIAFGVLAGYLNGLLITKINLPPFIVTLGTLSIFTAIALLYSGGSSIIADDMPASLNFLGESFGPRSFRLTVGVVVVVVLYLIVGFVLSQTAWGRHVYAVGDDPESARLSGVASQRVLLSVYTLAGLIYGIGAWMLIGRSGAATPNAVGNINLETITAVVIGGTSLFGGRGTLVGTLLGALIVNTFGQGLSILGVSPQWKLLAIGVLVIVAVAVDQWIRRVKA
ncbi:ABC transporter permease [Oryzobacter telluris]|uniref:ABC transporter permease n=1 Tax=Oryzobacter telluris TaxID=3149179 RepID=UPI00370D1228